MRRWLADGARRAINVRYTIWSYIQHNQLILFSFFSRPQLLVIASYTITFAAATCTVANQKLAGADVLAAEATTRALPAHENKKRGPWITTVPFYCELP